MTVAAGTPALNPAQREAVEHPGGPLLVLAGAGSGKTRVLTMRLAHLIQTGGVAPERIFAVTFTNKAAAEMRTRVGALLGADPKGLWIGTFHSLSARLLRREAPHLGFGSNFTIYDADDSQAFIKRLMEPRGYGGKAYPPRAVHALISAAKNRLLTPAEYAHKADTPLEKCAAEIYGLLGPALRQANAMDFDDLLIHPLTLFREHPERLQAWQRRFRHVLVDEFQDTNAAQYQLVKLLAAEHHNLCVVGDDDQAIYGWRGADVRHMLQFEREHPATKIIRLEQNYRSTQMILDAANGVISHNTDRLGKTLFTAQQGGEPVVLLTAADERDEAEWIAREFSDIATKTDIDYEGMAVLYRTNAQSRAFEEAMRFRGIPYRLVGAVSFYERREVKDVLSYLRLIANPADDEAFLRVINVPRRGLGDASVALLVRWAGTWGKPLLTVAAQADRLPDLRPNLREAFKGFAARIEQLRARFGNSDPATILQEVIRAVDYEAYLADEGAEGVERLDNVAELVAGAAAWAEVTDVGEAGADEDIVITPLQRYLTEAALVTPADATSGAGVTLLTAHTAKGLEWPVVAVAGMEEGLFPLGRAANEDGGVEEERRLCYVGLTRARERLYLSWARMRFRYGRLEMGEPSRFLEAIPGKVLTERGTSARWEAPARRRSVRRERDEPDADTPWPEDESQDAPRYASGERVRHRKFGSGVVRSVSGRGRDLKVTVQFDDAGIGTKQLLVAYAGLEREWDSA